MPSRSTAAALSVGSPWVVPFDALDHLSGALRGDVPGTWLASTFCGLAETAWELTLEGHMGVRQVPGFLEAVLLHGLGSR
ncbi:hypothetical protein ACFXO9_17210 [Nocardia tengchongensis]|uniref:hypothetical protein n=1 Tax=Nocardia tengchongensis TaxID=2055889 RepID=UPI003684389F